MNKELMEALDILEKEKNISKDTLLEAIEQSLIQGLLPLLKATMNASSSRFNSAL